MTDMSNEQLCMKTIMQNYNIIKLSQLILPPLGTSWHDQGLPEYKNNKLKL